MIDRESYEKRSGRDRFFRLLEEEMRLLIDPATGEMRRDWAEAIACVLCGARDEEELFRKGGLRFVRCRSCRLIYMNPRPSAEGLERLYACESAANDAWVDVLLSEAEEEFQTRDFSALLDEVQRLRPAGRLLDVGCSIGRLLALARGRGYDVLGIELGGRARTYAREHYGLPVLGEKLECADLASESFDAVALVEVLEHLPDPRRMLSEVRRILKPGGVLLAGVPNAGSLGVMVLHGEARTFNRNHLVYFGEGTLVRLLEQEGFRVVKAMTVVSLLDTVLNHFQMLDPFGVPRTDLLPQPLRQAVESPQGRARLEKLLHDLGLGYRLRAIAVREGQS
ncbi:MAG: class I SAM-dependent methyltransferase [Gemmatimonadetes bacterium]|nr:class I SAM-dependent methyltransferase [Gemmatimonadota bacterium]